MFALFVSGSPATFRFAPGFPHLPLHHVRHLVCNDQQSKWVSCCLSPHVALLFWWHALLWLYSQFSFNICIYWLSATAFWSYWWVVPWHTIGTKSCFLFNSWHTFLFSCCVICLFLVKGNNEQACCDCRVSYMYVCASEIHLHTTWNSILPTQK